ncbi:hypothetical protein [Paenibacillus spongiae]|nr:hypothetical protein [Paenibacillus spongiae]
MQNGYLAVIHEARGIAVILIHKQEEKPGRFREAAYNRLTA